MKLTLGTVLLHSRLCAHLNLCQLPSKLTERRRRLLHPCQPYRAGVTYILKTTCSSRTVILIVDLQQASLQHAHSYDYYETCLCFLFLCNHSYTTSMCSNTLGIMSVHASTYFCQSCRTVKVKVQAHSDRHQDWHSFAMCEILVLQKTNDPPDAIGSGGIAQSAPKLHSKAPEGLS